MKMKTLLLYIFRMELLLLVIFWSALMAHSVKSVAVYMPNSESQIL